MPPTVLRLTGGLYGDFRRAGHVARFAATLQGRVTGVPGVSIHWTRSTQFSRNGLVRSRHQPVADLAGAPMSAIRSGSPMSSRMLA